MNLFTKSLSLFYWISLSFCAASEGNTTIGNTELDFLNNDDLRFLKLTKDEIKEALCINDVHGKDHRQFVIDFLKAFLERQKVKTLSLWVLKNIILAISKNEDVSFKFHQRDITASLAENQDDGTISVDALSLIYSFIFQFIKDNMPELNLNFEKFKLKVPTIRKNSATNESAETNPHQTSLLSEAIKEPGAIEAAKDDIISNLTFIMVQVERYLERSKIELPIRDVENIETLSKEELKQISDFFEKTILSEKFSIVIEKK